MLWFYSNLGDSHHPENQYIPVSTDGKWGTSLQPNQTSQSSKRNISFCRKLSVQKSTKISIRKIDITNRQENSAKKLREFCYEIQTF